ncbi:MAG TPA: hypothetical protein DCO83_10065 [Mucilaginibacter sp.]|jgi:hypothetical protein|nr:hypothetical protein [Mucilaginibacter sp.]
MADQLNKKLAGKENIDKKIKGKFRCTTKNYPVNIAKYEQQEAMPRERKSYSKPEKGLIHLPDGSADGFHR